MNSLQQLIAAARSISDTLVRRCVGRERGPLPNFLIAGATRSGTTSLWNYLRQHPDVFMPKKKELGFFDNNSLYHQGLAEYRRHFAGWRGEQAVGEATPRYFMQSKLYDAHGAYHFDPLDDAAARIAADLPNIRSILTLRNPVERAFSQFRKGRTKGTESAPDFRTAIEDELQGRRTPKNSRRCLIFDNQYHSHIRRWLELFPAENVKIIVFEEWIPNPQPTFRQLCNFLSIDNGFSPASFPVHNSGKDIRPHGTPHLSFGLDRKSAAKVARPTLDSKTYEFVHSIFSEDIRALEKLLERRLEAWIPPKADIELLDEPTPSSIAV